MTTLGDILVDADGLRASEALKTASGENYRLVAISRSAAAVVVPDSQMNLQLTCGDGGDVTTIAMEGLDNLIDGALGLLRVGLQMALGKCYLQNKQTATFDPKTGNMTGFTNSTEIVCNSPS